MTWGRTQLRKQFADAYRVFDHDIGQAYGTILSKRGREPRPPLDWDRIGAMLQALIEGFTLRSKVDPTAVPQSSGSDLGLYATAVAAVLGAVTRPADDAADLNEALHVLLDGRAGPRPRVRPKYERSDRLGLPPAS